MPEIPDYTNEDRMPFGAYTSQPLNQVPADYLLHQWENGWKDLTEEQGTKRGRMARYVKAHIEEIRARLA
jgi:uncharacterized protein (DUF3820 family)